MNINHVLFVSLAIICLVTTIEAKKGNFFKASLKESVPKVIDSISAGKCQDSRMILSIVSMIATNVRFICRVNRGILRWPQMRTRTNVRDWFANQKGYLHLHYVSIKPRKQKAFQKCRLITPKYSLVLLFGFIGRTQWMHQEQWRSSQSVLQPQHNVAVGLSSAQASLHVRRKTVGRLYGSAQAHAHRLLRRVYGQHPVQAGSARRFSAPNARMAVQHSDVSAHFLSSKTRRFVRRPTPLIHLLSIDSLIGCNVCRNDRSEHSKLSTISAQEDLAHKWVDAVIWKYCDLDKEPADR